jgi:hypothetical protein
MKPKRIALIIATWPEYELYCPNFTGMQDGLRDLDIPFKVFTCRPTFNWLAVVEYNPNLIVYGLPDMAMHKEWRDELKKRLKAKIVMWYGDWKNNLEIKCDMPEIDCMFVSNNASHDFYKKNWKVKRCEFLPLGASIKTSEFKEKFSFPVVFIGHTVLMGSNQGRAEKILQIKGSVPLTILNGNAKDNPKLREKIMKEVPNIYFSSKICLDMNTFSGIKGYTSNRAWVIPACGGFAISEYWPQSEEFFPEGTRVWFKTIPEAIEKIKYYLSHDEEREKIRLAGLENAKNHTYDKRWLQMFSML